MSFYVQLPSNSYNAIENNTTTKFTTNFQTPLPLDLNFKYEVGLVESIYTQSWTIQVGYLFYGYLKELNNIGQKQVPVSAFDKILITFHDGDNLEQFIQKINDRIDSSIIERKYNELLKKKFILQRKGQLDNPENFPSKEFSIHDENDQEIIKKIKDETEFKNAPKIVYRDNDLYLRFTDKYQSFQFFGRINSILKVLHNKDTMFSSIIIATKNEMHYEKINLEEKFNLTSPIYLLGTFYVYTDIIDNQFVGNTKAPLLKTIVINYNNSQSISWSHYDNPQYLEVNKTEINSILIDIRDEFGDKILFDAGTFTIKLHFRTKNV